MKAFLFSAFLASFTSAGAAISSVFVFGDSLSDNGNANTLSLGLAPERFTNGATWNERLGVPMTSAITGGTNFAVGGAQTDRGLIPFTGLNTQISQFETSVMGTGADPSALYVIFIGGNDLARIVAEPPLQAPASILGGVNRIFQAVTALQGAGAQNILVANAPDISKTPVVVDQVMGDPMALNAVSGAVNLWNSGVAAGVNNLADPQVQLLDINTPFLEIVNNPAAFGITNVTDEASTTPGANPDEYLFWDGFHPTAVIHQAIADEVLTLVPVPEPASSVLLVLGSFALITRRR